MLHAQPAEATATDEKLMGQVAQGDRAAYAQLVSRHVNRAYALARRIGSRPAEAEEVAQEAFLRVWTHATQWSEDKGRFSAWLSRIVTNLCIDRMRRSEHAAVAWEEAAEAVADPSVDLESDLHRRQLAQQVAAEVARLPDRQRMALSLCHYGGVSNADAADILGVSVGAVEALLVRARRTLAQRLQSLNRL
ncbi:sigma-70 family RNA polymerase sigma factor [Methylogaea oryzae]|uniref:RNA polymerase sigma factor n=1 Tax=Methylogaea oryzae TaxID=1295382 RepID=A0A8D4VMC4_9GAMM|nr:sigma-70 family RNA polymerase sigma factor [Methylogaea oryzae]BBL70808.1 RNA polymerase sigma factor [Methylogaea oryzae]